VLGCWRALPATVTALIGKRLGSPSTDDLRLPDYPTTPTTDIAMPGKRPSFIHRQWPRFDSDHADLSQVQLAPNTLQYKGK
jgi:hypothetical protein